MPDLKLKPNTPILRFFMRKKFEGADRGLQISTAVEREGSLSSCSFREAVTWKKYRSADEDTLIQIWGEYSIILPILAAFVLSECEPRKAGNLIDNIPDYVTKLVDAYESE